jgi:hypothetical protein
MNADTYRCGGKAAKKWGDYPYFGGQSVQFMGVFDIKKPANENCSCEALSNSSTPTGVGVNGAQSNQSPVMQPRHQIRLTGRTTQTKNSVHMLAGSAA